MATTATNSASRFSIDSSSSSLSRSRHGDPSPWMIPAPHDHPFDTSSDLDIADKKKPVWNMPSSHSQSHPSSAPVMGASESWPALSLSSTATATATATARPSSNKSPSFDSDGSSSSSSSSMPMPPPQAGGTPLNSTSNAIITGSSVAATSSEDHTVNGHRKPFRPSNNNNTSSSTSNISNATPAPPPFSTRDQNHSQRGAFYLSRTSYRNRNTSSYPRGEGHGNRRHYDHEGNQSGFSHRNHTGRDMHLQPQRGIGMMLMGPPSFPATSAQYLAAPQYGGPMLYSDYAPHVFMPHPSPEPIGLVGPFPPLPLFLSSFDAILYNKILTQVEYYFSADNLSRDKHLRDQMNDEGWVPVRVIAGFRRLAELTNNIQTILEALKSSQVVEINGETLRRRGDWDKYRLHRESSESGPAAAASDNASLVSQLESITLSEGSREGE